MFWGNFGADSSLPAQFAGAAGTHSFTWGLGGLVPASHAAGALGPGGLCGLGSVRLGDAGLGFLRSAVRMLLRPTEEEEAGGLCDLDASKRLESMKGRMVQMLNFVLVPPL